MEKELLLPAFDLTDKVAVVTGSSKGLGKWIAMGLAQAGADVLVTYCGSKNGGEDTCEQISALGRKTCLVRVDVREVDSIEAMVQTAVKELGGLDIMINNAGISIRKPAFEITPEEYDSVAQVNQKGTYFGCQFAGRVMAERGGGKIINMASAAAFLVRKGLYLSVYAMTKAGLVMLTKASLLPLFTQTS